IGKRMRVLVVELAIQRPGRADEAAETDRPERGVFSVAIAILPVLTDGAGEVPAVVELLRGSSLRNAEPAQQCGTEEFLVHVQLLDQGKETCSYIKSETAVPHAIPARLGRPL